MMPASAQADLLKAFRTCSDTARDLYLPRKIERIDHQLSPLEFYRRFVSKNIPCIFTNATQHWPAHEKWSHKYLKETMGDKKISVAVTGNGMADAVTNGIFLLPEERQMSMGDFLDRLEQPDHKSFYYVQKQDSNLTKELGELLPDVEAHIPWVSEALDIRPDAVNFWMGSSQSVSALHKDHYENMYVVVRGSKTFTLIPPIDRLYINYIDFPVGRQKYIDGQWTVDREEMTVPWIPIDPLKPDFDKFPDYKFAQPITVTVKPGEMLYLPSMWFHHVQQSDFTVAVNYWYDMTFDNRYCMYETCANMSQFRRDHCTSDNL